ncbi:MAG: pseudouridine synthase [Bacteroidota bacterium]
MKKDQPVKKRKSTQKTSQPSRQKRKPKQFRKETDPEKKIDPNAPMRLNRFIARAGVCARREADRLIAEGAIKLNGKVVTELGTKVIPGKDKVEYEGKVLKMEQFVYLLLNKPKNLITTMDDPEGRKTVIDHVRNATNERIYPVGRLDRKTTGLLLLTNDGQLAKKMTHPSHRVRKIYHVRLDKAVAETDLQRLVDGIDLEDGPAKADKVDYVQDKGPEEVGIEIHIGRNRIVRRMFEAMGYQVVHLDRVLLGSLTKKNLPRGKWRMLTPKEVGFLKMM